MLAIQVCRAAGARRTAVPLARTFWNVSLPVVGGPGGAHITKYHIVKPGKEGVEWEDFLIKLPERDHLASFSKEVPLFLRYLKVVTDQEGRDADFKAFVDRAKSGLVVESDAHITTEELLALMWKNGYSEQERNAIQFTFPNDYKFHYPELSVLFNLEEEDTYKFCMRTRIESSHIGELDYDKIKRKGFIRDHWLIFGVGVGILKFFPFFNYYFAIKVFGTSMSMATFWIGLNRWIAKICRRNEYMAAQKTAQDVMEGEDKIVESMKRFAKDAQCVEHLQGFKAETEAKVADYKKAMVLKMKADLSERATKQLQSISSFEANMGAAMQELAVHEAAASFKEQFPTSLAMKQKAFEAALKQLEGQTLEINDDPVSAHFNNAFMSLQGTDLQQVTGDPNGTLAERMAAAQRAKELEFEQSFMVTASEANEVKSIARQAKTGDDYDFNKLAPSDAERLEALYTKINAKVGYAMPEATMKPISLTSDSAANSYIEQVNANLALAMGNLRDARLKAFVQAF